MKPTVVADEMFPEGAGPFMELDEVNREYSPFSYSGNEISNENGFLFVCNLKAGGSTGLLMDLAANEKDVHADFFNGMLIVHIFFAVITMNHFVWPFWY